MTHYGDPEYMACVPLLHSRVLNNLSSVAGTFLSNSRPKWQCCALCLPISDDNIDLIELRQPTLFSFSAGRPSSSFKVCYLSRLDRILTIDKGCFDIAFQIFTRIESGGSVKEVHRQIISSAQLLLLTPFLDSKLHRSAVDHCDD